MTETSDDPGDERGEPDDGDGPDSAAWPAADVPGENPVDAIFRHGFEDMVTRHGFERDGRYHTTRTRPGRIETAAIMLKKGMLGDVVYDATVVFFPALEELARKLLGPRFSLARRYDQVTYRHLDHAHIGFSDLEYRARNAAWEKRPALYRMFVSRPRHIIRMAGVGFKGAVLVAHDLAGIPGYSIDLQMVPKSGRLREGHFYNVPDIGAYELAPTDLALLSAYLSAMWEEYLPPWLARFEVDPLTALIEERETPFVGPEQVAADPDPTRIANSVIGSVVAHLHWQRRDAAREMLRLTLLAHEKAPDKVHGRAFEQAHEIFLVAMAEELASGQAIGDDGIPDDRNRLTGHFRHPAVLNFARLRHLMISEFGEDPGLPSRFHKPSSPAPKPPAAS